MPDLLRRVAVLTAMSVVGIALLAPLSARSARPEAAAEVVPLLAGLPDGAVSTLARSALVDRAGVNGATLAPSGPGSAESVAPRLGDRAATVPMQATLVTIPTAPPPPPAVTYSGDTVWDTLAMCEASGNWAANTGNGYYGGLQFSVGTWNGYGGAEYAAYPHQATRDQQITVAERLRAARGYQPWPACRAKLGLP